MIEHRPDKLEDELCFAIYSAQKRYSKFYSESLKPFELTYSQYITLLVLWEEKRPLLVKEVGERLGLDTGTLTPMLRRMEKKGWLTRSQGQDDGRRVYIELTPKGLDAETPIKDAVESCFSHVNMNEEEYKQSVDKISQIAEFLEANNRLLSQR